MLKLLMLIVFQSTASANLVGLAAVMESFIAPSRRFIARRRLPSRFPSRIRSLTSLASHLPNIQDNAATSFPSTPQNLTEKIVQQHAIGIPHGKFVQSGDYVALRPFRCMTHDNSWPVAMKFTSIGATKIHNPNQLVMTLDHDVQNRSEINMRKYRNIEAFAMKHGVEFYPAGHGVGHQVLIDEGHAWPGTLVVASDSHATTYGGLGCLGHPLVRTDAASIWVTGQSWWRIPPVAKVTFTGTLPKGVTGKDAIIALCGVFNNGEVQNHAIEFTGSDETMRSLSIDERLTIANMTTEWGALSGLFPIDSLLQSWLRSKATEYAMYQPSSRAAARYNHKRLDELFTNPTAADEGCRYAKHLTLDLSTLAPYVAGPNSVKVATPLFELEPRLIKIDRAYIISCTNGRRSDIAAAAKVFKDAAKENKGVIPKIADHVNLYIAAASLSEQRAAEDQGDWQALIEAGAQPLASGCGPCIGLGIGLLEPGEVGISASNRNFKGRMGAANADAYLASPEVVAASALAGKITGPGWYERPAEWAGVVGNAVTPAEEPIKELSVEDALSNVIGKLDSIIEAGLASTPVTPVAPATSTSVSRAPTSPDGSLQNVPHGFPETISGEIVFCDADWISTDGIYPGKFTYQDDVTKEKMAEVCMSNYDPAFSGIARHGDILVAGDNFGCGSSREQAATALLASGIRLVVATSFNSTFERNAVNNALLCLEAPHLVNQLREAFTASDDLRTRRTGWTLQWDAHKGIVTVRKDVSSPGWSFHVPELSPNVQEIIACGGLENWVRNSIV
ncbi:hypothetical protein B7494_g7788 [Chlorociboria aeruginascens]|nr:hypothetical protein B7494_g7788 [Chlorociboria aeruginascens]